MVIRDMVSKDNLRPDGRGLIDSRPVSYQVTFLLLIPSCCQLTFAAELGHCLLPTHLRR